MKKTAILIAMMMVVVSVAFAVTGCGNGEETKATEPSATPIATVAPTQKATTAPTVPTATQPSTITAATTPTQAATFNTQIATGTMPATVPTGTGNEAPTVSQHTSASLGTPNENGGYTLVGTVTGYGSSTVVIMLADGSEYEFNYVNSGVSTDSLYDGATVTIVSDGDPTGDAVPNAVQMIVS